MKPITTPGNASGNVRIATRRLRPVNCARARKTPLMTQITSVTAVTPAAKAAVRNSVDR
jgi:hypothetical protein